ncbi:WD40 repeat domain-containing protein [Nocardia terpenica]|uniref:WD40 repeat domain-containing protein n=1 Tax=Nocardia terpenica TaxID=455432 RepID=UPI001EEA1B39|nr:WD40 repeat domain-containing protein [Nocardia terpenica]
MDLSWARNSTQLSLRNSEFRSSTASLAAPVHGRSKRDIDSEDVRQQRILARLRNGAFAVILTLAIVAAVGLWQAVQARNLADARTRDAVAQRLLAESQAMLGSARPGGDVQAFKELLMSRSMSGGTDSALIDALYKRSALESVVETPTTILQVVYRPDGKMVVTSGADDNSIRMWNVGTGQQVGELNGHTDTVNSLAITGDGKRLVSGSVDGTIRLWDIDAKRQVGSAIQAGGPVTSLALSPDGKRILSSEFDNAENTGVVRFWDIDSGKPTAELTSTNGTGMGSVAYSPDGRTFAFASSDGFVNVYDANTLAQTIQPLHGDRPADSVTFSPDGTHIATGDDFHQVHVWEVSSGRETASFATVQNTVEAVRFSLDGRRIVIAAADDTVSVWDASTGQQIGLPFVGHNKPVNSIAISPDGENIASGGDDKTLRFWTMSALPLLGHQGDVLEVAFSPDGKRIASVGPDGIRLWDASSRTQTNAPFTGHSGVVTSVAFSPDGRYLATGGVDRTVRLWDAGSGVEVGEPIPSQSAIFAVAFSRDGHRIATGGVDATVRLWDVASHTEIGAPMTGHTASVWSVAFSPDGKLLASGGGGGVRLWDATTGQQKGPALNDPHYALTSGDVLSVAFSPDSRHIVSGDSGSRIHQWDVATGAMIQPVITGHVAPVTSVTYTPNGRYIVSGSKEGTIRLWDAATGQEIASPLVGHNQGVRSVAVDTAGTRIVSGGDDSAIFVWPIYFPPRSELLCRKLTSPVSRQEWNAWTGPATIPYTDPCVRGAAA